eukprot:c27243_g1_i1 orf=347-1651(+)
MAAAFIQQSGLSVPRTELFSGSFFFGKKPCGYAYLTRKLKPASPAVIRCAAVAPSPSPFTNVSHVLASENDGRVYNFAAGPATLPAAVLKKAQAELYNWRGCGMSIMEMSHRGKEFLSVIQKAEADLRSLLRIPEDYAVLFVQGGATSQFSAVPLNLCSPEDTADYIISGAWSDKSLKEAKKYTQAKAIWNGKSSKYVNLPSEGDYELTPGAKYVHVCTNETIHGVEFKHYPSPQDGAVLVADMSSNFCSKPIDVSKFGLIYAGAQKNIGPSGVTIVIVRRDLVGNAQSITPVMLDYTIHEKNKSLYNTPPCFGIYICGLVFEDLLAQGGLESVEKKNTEKAQLLYDAIDESNGFYQCPVEKSVRSVMNVPFTMETPELEAKFLSEASAQGMVQLKGHRSVGGIRASIYNAMPKAGVEKLVALMKSFKSRHTCE